MLAHVPDWVWVGLSAYAIFVVLLLWCGRHLALLRERDHHRLNAMEHGSERQPATIVRFGETSDRAAQSS